MERTSMNVVARATSTLVLQNQVLKDKVAKMQQKARHLEKNSKRDQKIVKKLRQSVGAMRREKSLENREKNQSKNSAEMYEGMLVSVLKRFKLKCPCPDPDTCTHRRCRMLQGSQADQVWLKSRRRCFPRAKPRMRELIPTSPKNHPTTPVYHPLEPPIENRGEDYEPPSPSYYPTSPVNSDYAMAELLKKI